MELKEQTVGNAKMRRVFKTEEEFIEYQNKQNPGYAPPMRKANTGVYLDEEDEKNIFGNKLK